VNTYAVITPARNESEHIEQTIRSMVGQSARPSRWILVDDGSSDSTGALVDAAAREHPWISAIHRPDRGARRPGAGVIETFYAGFQVLGDSPWDFLVKFDADLSFEPDYFERCLGHFHQDSRLGIGGGMICRPTEEGGWKCESPGDPSFHVRGATKIYRRACWDAIGGLLQAPGWDTVDEFKANMLGWRTRTFPDIPLQHHRYTGTADGTWRNLVKFGLANYVAGYHPLFMLAKCVRRFSHRPWGAGSVALAWGFAKGYMYRSPRVEDPKLRQYVRQQQINCLRKRPSLWDGRIGDAARA